MAEITRQYINVMFYYLCLISALALAFWCMFEYSKNYDITEISFQAFNPDKQGNQYPSMTLCTVDSYNDSKFSQYNDSAMNSKSYSKFLRGKYWNKNMLSVDYDFVTIDVEEYVIGACILTTRSKTDCQKFGNIQHFTRVWTLGVMKCFSFKHEAKGPINQIFIAMNNSIHPNGLRKAFGHFFILFHYPDQIIRAVSNTFSTWPLRTIQMSDYYSMRFKVSNVEILKRRRNGREKCHFWEKYDQRTIEDVMASVGCQPPYWKSRRGHQPCTSQKQLGNVHPHFYAKSMQDDRFQQYIPPCIEITKMDVDFEEKLGIQSKFGYETVHERFIKDAGTRHGWFFINTHFWQSTYFREIRKIKAYSLQNMIGNAGGYIGLLVGITISDLPCLIFKLYFLFKGRSCIMDIHTHGNHVLLYFTLNLLSGIYYNF